MCSLCRFSGSRVDRPLYRHLWGYSGVVRVRVNESRLITAQDNIMRLMEASYCRNADDHHTGLIIGL